MWPIGKTVTYDRLKTLNQPSQVCLNSLSCSGNTRDLHMNFIWKQGVSLGSLFSDVTFVCLSIPQDTLTSMIIIIIIDVLFYKCRHVFVRGVAVSSVNYYELIKSATVLSLLAHITFNGGTPNSSAEIQINRTETSGGIERVITLQSSTFVYGCRGSVIPVIRAMLKASGQII